jgi:hypothetical protein
VTQKLTIDLNVFDADGIVVDGTTAEMTLPQISDVIDHATQLILLRRDGKDVSEVMDELEEALVSSGVLPEAEPGLLSRP